METSKQLTLELCHDLTCSAADSPANPSPWPASAREQPTTAGSGRSSTGPFARLNPDGSWSKMFQDFCQLTLDGSSEAYCETWPKSGMMRNGTCFRRRSLGRRTCGSGSFLWQTPSVEDASRTGSIDALMEYQENGRTTQCRLRNQVKMWPTPSTPSGGRSYRAGTVSPTGMKENGQKRQIDLSYAVKMWSTPANRDYRSPNQNGNMENQLLNVIGGQLNPTWVE